MEVIFCLRLLSLSLGLQSRSSTSTLLHPHIQSWTAKAPASPRTWSIAGPELRCPADYVAPRNCAATAPSRVPTAFSVRSNASTPVGANPPPQIDAPIRRRRRRLRRQRLVRESNRCRSRALPRKSSKISPIWPDLVPSLPSVTFSHWALLGTMTAFYWTGSNASKRLFCSKPIRCRVRRVWKEALPLALRALPWRAQYMDNSQLGVQVSLFVRGVSGPYWTVR
jgi:hypothetical protein